MSPNTPASLTPIASITAMQPSGIASIAARVEIGEAQDSGVARSSRAGTKRSVKASPTSRGCPGRSGRAPRIQTLRSPFFNSTVVMVAVETRVRMAMASGVSDMEGELSSRVERRRIFGRATAHVKLRGHRRGTANRSITALIDTGATLLMASTMPQRLPAK